MEHIILFRWPKGRVDFVAEDGNEIAVFHCLDDAVACADGHHLLQNVSYQIVCLDEL